MRVLIIGTDHNYQTGNSNCSKQEIEVFTANLKEIVTRYSVVGIFEEMNEEGLNKYHVSSTLAQDISNQLGLKHKFVDPNTHERKTLGIKERGKLQMHGLMNDWSQNKIKKAIEEQDIIREGYWLEQLQKYAKGTIIFICGAIHSNRFLSLLSINNVASEIISDNLTSKDSA